MKLCRYSKRKGIILFQERRGPGFGSGIGDIQNGTNPADSYPSEFNTTTTCPKQTSTTQRLPSAFKEHTQDTLDPFVDLENDALDPIQDDVSSHTQSNIDFNECTPSGPALDSEPFDGQGMSSEKQVMMFSATPSKEIYPMCKNFMQDHYYIKSSELEKNRKLNDLLYALNFNQVVIFVKSVTKAGELNKWLVESNFPSICIHSDMSQEERLTQYKNFKEGHKRILVATDLVGGGIDYERVHIVINYDMPDSADTYVHRVDRAGRIGTKGLAITFVSSAADSDVLSQVQERVEVVIKELPEQIDTSTYIPS